MRAVARQEELSGEVSALRLEVEQLQVRKPMSGGPTPATCRSLIPSCAMPPSETLPRFTNPCAACLGFDSRMGYKWSR